MFRDLRDFRKLGRGRGQTVVHEGHDWMSVDSSGLRQLLHAGDQGSSQPGQLFDG